MFPVRIGEFGHSSAATGQIAQSGSAEKASVYRAEGISGCVRAAGGWITTFRVIVRNCIFPSLRFDGPDGKLL